MAMLGLEREVVGRDVYDRTVARFREGRIALPTFAQLADPAQIPEAVRGRLEKVDPDRKSTRLNSSHIQKSRMPSSA